MDIRTFIVKLAILLAFQLALSSTLVAQMNPCGTHAPRSNWLKEYQKDPSKFNIRAGNALHLPMRVVLVSPSDASSNMLETDALEAFCTLANDLVGTDIVAYLYDGISYIYNDNYYKHETVIEGGEMMFANNSANVINNYIVFDPAGNCGYNLPYAGIALSRNCVDPEDHTWVHELGHALSLPHPFLGWEGGISYDGSIGHDFNQPAPDTVYIDYTYFKDTLILDTLIIDTIIVERLDGSNCQYAADGFCDTAPDYLASRWQCDGNDISILQQTDPNGGKFYSDGTLFMSYAFDTCSDRFSEDQIGAMRANILDKKPQMLDQVPMVLPSVTATTQHISPAENALEPKDKVVLEWEAVDNAEYYLVQLGIEPSNSIIYRDTVVSANSVVWEDLKVDDYYWRVKAFNGFDVCTPPWSSGRKFTTGDFSAVEDIDAASNLFSLHPNPSTEGDIVSIVLDANTTATNKLNYVISDMSGRQIAKGNGNQIDCRSLSNQSLYFVSVYAQGKYLNTVKLVRY